MIEKMIENMPAKTGRTLAEWIGIIQHERGELTRHREMVDLLRDKYNLGLNYADIVVHKANKTDSGSQDGESLITRQYDGKESLRHIYDLLMREIQEFGSDIAILPKNSYVSLRRKKQFACLKPATKTRFELELIIRNQQPEGKLEIIKGAGAMCTHKIRIERLDQVDEEVIKWALTAYNQAV